MHRNLNPGSKKAECSHFNETNLIQFDTMLRERGKYIFQGLNGTAIMVAVLKCLEKDCCYYFKDLCC